MNVKLLLLFADVSQHIIKNEWPCETTRPIFRPKTLIFLLQLHMVASVALITPVTVWFDFVLGYWHKSGKRCILYCISFWIILRAFVIWLSQLWSKATEEKELAFYSNVFFFSKKGKILRFANCLMKTKLFIKMMVSYGTRSRFTETYRKAANAGTATHYLTI